MKMHLAQGQTIQKAKSYGRAYKGRIDQSGH